MVNNTNNKKNEKNFFNNTLALFFMANFVTGFTDGEGSFQLKVRKKKIV